MGNPPILQHASPGAGLEPPRMRALWTVYRLRDRGEKMAREQVLLTGQLGLLEFWRPPDRADALNACLSAPSSGTSLDNLYNVRLVRGEREGGLLLQGVVLSSRQGVVAELPQAWWCLITSVTPRP